MREKILFNQDWIFHKGDIKTELPSSKGTVYAQAKTERYRMGPACKDYIPTIDNYADNVEHRSEQWKRTTLPHDYMITSEVSKENNCALGFVKYENAWYRKTFNIPAEDLGKRLTLYFEGIAGNSTVYLNGCLMKHNFSAYTSFEVDITDVAVYGGSNVLAVYINTAEHSGWWYEGGGINRNVWLCKTNPVCVDLWGVYVAPKKVGGSWQLPVSVEVINSGYETAEVKVESTVLDALGNQVATLNSAVTVESKCKGVAKCHTIINNPTLWELEAPYIYSLQTKLFIGGNEIDCVADRFGFREIIADPNEGLFVNGKHVKIKGVCAHNDCGLLGRAVSENVQRYKIELLKEMGANGYRTSHYPHDEATMNALDEMGFIVLDETRWFESTDEGLEQLRMLVKRDRNRPSVFFWSLGNEEAHHITEQGRRICKAMYQEVKKLDASRLITTAVSVSPDKATVFDCVDAVGINYNLQLYDGIHEARPEMPVFASECCATSSTRGWYGDIFWPKAYMPAYDKDTDSWFLGREKTWKFITERKWVLGEYQWSGFEHRGEAVWPRLCSQAGAIDLFLQKKDAFYQNQTHWITNKPLVHLLPHWNFKGMEGRQILVFAYTNCEEIELFLNGKSLGRQTVGGIGHGEWKVNYQSGKIEAVGYNGGKAVAKHSHETTGEPVKLNLRLDNKISKANGRDVAIITCYCTDSQGRVVPDASPLVNFACNNGGELLATGSDISDHTPLSSPERKMRAGAITLAVRVANYPTYLEVYATADRLESAYLCQKID